MQVMAPEMLLPFPATPCQHLNAAFFSGLVARYLCVNVYYTCP